KAIDKVIDLSLSIIENMYQRGKPIDYVRCGAGKGMESCDYAHVLTYFKKLENAIDSPNDKFRGHDGPIKLTRGPAVNPLFNAFFEAGEQAGYPRTSDV